MSCETAVKKGTVSHFSVRHFDWRRGAPSSSIDMPASCCLSLSVAPVPYLPRFCSHWQRREEAPDGIDVLVFPSGSLNFNRRVA